MSNVSRILACLVLATAVWGCEKEPTVRDPPPELSDYLPALGPGGAATIRFLVDSTVFDPAPGGTAVRTRTEEWTLADQDSATTDDRLYLVTKRDTAAPTRRSEQFWAWSALSEGRGITNTLGGITYLGLTVPFEVGSTWDVLAYTQTNLVVPIDDEPVAIHKDWAAAIDSVGVYRFDGIDIDAVWVSHARSENRIELRRVREVYGRGYGLLERHVEILDSQDLRDLPWAQKAERGFTLQMRRLP